MKLKIYVSLFMILILLGGSTFAASASQAAPNAGSYIVVFRATGDIPSTVSAVAQAHGLRVGYMYEHALQGMSASVPAGRLAALERDPRVAYVVEDMVRTISAQTIPTGIQRIFADTNTNLDIDGTDDYRVDADVAVIDTGIDLEHPDLNVVGSTSCLYSSGGGPPWARSYYCDAGGDDDHYHGTHVAGTIAALDNGFGVVGVAPGARLWAVKVCDERGSCPSSAIIAGIDHVAANADSIEVANMSLGGSGWNQAEYDAVQGAVNAGVAFAVAAGNDDDDAKDYSPAAFDNALTVSALADFDGAPGGTGSPTCRTDEDDTLADFSNWGDAVQIAAPGVCIYSTFPIEQGGYDTISGTSMASPHAAGALALLASVDNPGNATDVYNLYDQVINAGNFDWTDDSGDDNQEPLLDVSSFSAALILTGEPPNNPPTVSITSPADGASFNSGESISFAGSASDAEDGDLTASLVWTSDKDGQIGTGGSFSAILSDGTHTITASVTDSGGLPGEDSITITVGGGGGATMYVFDIAMSPKTAGPNRSAIATVTIKDTDGNPVEGATVYGTWSGDYSGSTSGTTGTDGTVSIESRKVRQASATFTFTVDDVVKSGYTYDPTLNVVEDSASITVP
jgi:subtilisin family serine protease